MGKLFLWASWWLQKRGFLFWWCYDLCYPKKYIRVEPDQIKVPKYLALSGFFNFHQFMDHLIKQEKYSKALCTIKTLEYIIMISESTPCELFSFYYRGCRHGNAASHRSTALERLPGRCIPARVSWYSLFLSSFQE